jgi:hypothetical protein
VFSSTGIALRTDNACAGEVTTGVVDVNGNPVKLFVLYGRRLKVRDVYVLNITALEAQYPDMFAVGLPPVLTAPTQWAKYVATDATPMKWVCSEDFAAGKDPDGLWGPQQGWGMVWHEESNAFLLFNNDQAVDNTTRLRNGHLRKLPLPVNALGRYDPNYPTTGTAWQYHDVALGVGSAIPDKLLTGIINADDSLVRGGSFSRFNILRKFNGTHDLLVNVSADDKPIYVMKLPIGGV